MGTYEFNGEQYQRASKHQKEWGRKLISELQLHGDEIVLDLGCGDGILTEQISWLVKDGSILGIDASKGMIAAAQQHGSENCTFLQMDINNIHFENKFDVIYSNAALHWVHHHDLLLTNCLKALKARGRIFWNFAGAGTCSNFFSVIRKKMDEEAYRNYFHNFVWPWFMPTLLDYQKLVEATGFSKFEVTEEHADRFFMDTEEMIRWIDQPSLVPFLQCIPNEKKRTFRNEVIEEMVQKALQPNGTCFETFRRIVVKARK